MTVSERRFLLNGGLEMAARVHHAGAPRRILAVHGWLDNAASFDALAAHLPEYEWLALDLIGHGWSDHRPPGSWYHYIDYLDELVQILDLLDWRNSIWLGHSLGGALLALLAAVRPERVERLVLIESLGPLSGDADHAAEQLRRTMDDRARHRAGNHLRVFADPSQAIAARRKVNGLSQAAATSLIGRGLRGVDDGFSWSSDPRLTLTSPARIDEAHIQSWLSAIACPTLLLLAEPPMPFLPNHLLAARLACLNDAQVLSFPGHHHLHMEDPAPLAAAIQAFVAD